MAPTTSPSAAGPACPAPREEGRPRRVTRRQLTAPSPAVAGLRTPGRGVEPTSAPGDDVDHEPVASAGHPRRNPVPLRTAHARIARRRAAVAAVGGGGRRGGARGVPGRGHPAVVAAPHGLARRGPPVDRGGGAPVAPERAAQWAVADAGSGDVLGRVALRWMDLAHGLAEAAYWVLPHARGRGVAPRSLAAMTRWALDEAGFHRLELAHSGPQLAVLQGGAQGPLRLRRHPAQRVAARGRLARHASARPGRGRRVSP